MLGLKVIGSAARIQSRNVLARHAKHTGEIAADEYLGVGLNSAGADTAAPERLRSTTVTSRQRNCSARRFCASE